MRTERIACPHLPEALDGMSWRSLNAHREHQAGEFYEAALRYAQHLWQRGLSARALLAVDRALYADLKGDESILKDFPMPYAVVAWMIQKNPPGVFIGNPRVHYQHLADRVKGERAEQKRWRAWACWTIVRRVAPDLPSDPKHRVVSPIPADIRIALTEHGIPGEAGLWASVLGSGGL